MGLCGSKRIDIIDDDFDLKNNNRVFYKSKYKILYEIKIINDKLAFIKHYVIDG
jgi:hypothetical protein